MDLIKRLSELDLWYIPIIVVCVLLLAGFLNGFFRGWKSSLYFMIWNLIGFYVALLVLDAIYDSVLKDMAKNWFAAIANNLGEKAFDDFFTLFHGWLVLMMVLLVLSFWNFIAWIVHFFFKKRFQKHLKENKAAGKSNAGSRLIGGFFGIVAVIPTAASAMASSTVISSNNTLNKNVDSFVGAMTFGKVTEVSGDWDAMYGLALSATSAQDLTLLLSGNVLTNNPAGNVIVDTVKINEMIDNTIGKNADSIVRMLNNDKSAKIAKDVIEFQFSNLKYTDNTALTSNELNAAQIKDIFDNCSHLVGIFKGLTDQGKQALDSLLAGNKTLKDLLVNPEFKA